MTDENKNVQGPANTPGAAAGSGASGPAPKDPGSKTSGVISDELKKNLDSDARQKTDKNEKVFDSNELVKVKIHYPDTWKKPRHHKQGAVVEMHPLTAKNYETNGIGKVISTTKAKEDTREPKDL